MGGSRRSTATTRRGSRARAGTPAIRSKGRIDAQAHDLVRHDAHSIHVRSIPARPRRAASCASACFGSAAPNRGSATPGGRPAAPRFTYPEAFGTLGCVEEMQMHHMRVASLVLAAAVSAFVREPAPSAQSPAAAPATGELLVYFGTYTGEKRRTARAIYCLAARSRERQAVRARSSPAETTNPSFLAVHPSGAFLYAANEVRELRRQEGGSVSGFAIDRTDRQADAAQRSSRRGGRGPAT